MPMHCTYMHPLLAHGTPAFTQMHIPTLTVIQIHMHQVATMSTEMLAYTHHLLYSNHKAHTRCRKGISNDGKLSTLPELFRSPTHV